MGAWNRADGVTWRLLGQRVLCTRHMGPSADLTGAAALVWVALDEPRTRDALVQDLAEFGAAAADIDDALRMLAEARLVGAA